MKGAAKTKPAILQKTRQLGLLAAKAYALRRSPTLLRNPKAVLNVRQETAWYLAKQNPVYIKRLNGFSKRAGFAMSPKCRLAITIPAYNEAGNIVTPLRYLAVQKNVDDMPIDPELFEIYILHGHPVGSERDKTKEVVESFKREHPGIRILYGYERPNKKSTIGEANKHLFDWALLRGAERKKQTGELILVRSNADMESISSHYVANLIKAFDENPTVDALTAASRLPKWALQKPNLRVATRLWFLIDRLSETGAAGTPREPAGVVGANSAIRSSIYAAVGGFNPKARQFEDTEMGWMISDARAWSPSRIIYIDKARIIEDPRRPLQAVANKTPVTEMYANFYTDTRVRGLDNKQLLASIPDDLDFDQLQREADAYWYSRDKGAYKYLGSKFETIFHEAMEQLGIKYRIVNDQVEITSVKDLLKKLSLELKRKVSLIGSKKDAAKAWRKPQKAMIDAYYSGISDSLLQARAAMAAKYAGQIQTIEQSREKSPEDLRRLRVLKRQYKRFADKDL
jgi:hypothetical protein